MDATINQKSGVFTLEYKEGQKNCVVISENIELLILAVKDKVMKLDITYNPKKYAST